MVINFKGKLFFIVGNSGSGKDSLIKEVLKNYPKELKPLIVPKRYITRPPSPDTEDFISITEKEFRDMLDKGEFLFHWGIYHKFYAVKKDIMTKIEEGYSILVNISRKILEEAREKYSFLRIIFVHVPFEITAQRIKERDREDPKELQERLERARKNQDLEIADFVVDNSGDLQTAGKQLLEYIIKEVEKNV
jgi:ribose 1,5-bisphosphokinase